MIIPFLSKLKAHDLSTLHCYQRSHWCPGLGHDLVAMLVPKGHATTGAMLILVTCTVTWGHGVRQARTAAESHVWVTGFLTARGCVAVHGSGYHRRLCQCHRSGSQPGALLVPEGHAAMRAMVIWVTCTATKDRVWVHGPTTAGSVLIAFAHGITKGHTDAWGLDCSRWLCYHQRAMLPLGPCWSGWQCRLLSWTMSGSVAQHQQVCNIIRCP